MHSLLFFSCYGQGFFLYKIEGIDSRRLTKIGRWYIMEHIIKLCVAPDICADASFCYEIGKG